MIVSEQMVIALATAGFPTFAVLIGIMINNQRLNDVNQRINDFARSVDQRFTETNRHIEDMKDVLRSEMYRVEQVLDARLKHLEELK
jgi:hypothetical protein